MPSPNRQSASTLSVLLIRCRSFYIRYIEKKRDKRGAWYWSTLGVWRMGFDRSSTLIHVNFNLPLLSMDKWTESVRRGCVVFNPSWRGLVQAGHASSHIHLTSLHKADGSFMTGINTAAGAISQVRPRGSLQVNPAGVGKTNGARQDSGVPSDMKHRSGYERRPGSVEHKAVRQICANQSMIGSAMSRRVNNFIDSPKSGRFFFTCVIWNWILNELGFI